MLIIVFTLKFSSSKGYASSVYFYKEGLCYEVIYDEDMNDTGEVVVYGTELLSEDNIIVPSSVEIKGNTYQVVGVANHGFQNLNIDSITLPASVKEIGKKAFSGCSHLSEIITENDAIDIGEDAFKDTAWMELQQDEFVVYKNILIEYRGNDSMVTIPAGIKIIGASTFSCAEIKSVNIPDSVEKIGDSAFMMCYKLTSIKIPDSVRQIDKNAFSGCYKLSKLNLPEDLEIIGVGAFEGTSITSMEFPEALKTIGGNAFASCSKLVSVKLNNGLKEIGAYAFAYTPIKKISVPGSMENIDQYAFSFCSELTEVVISNGVKSIDEDAFLESKKLKNIIIPPSVSDISGRAIKDTEFYTSLKKEFCIINNILVKYNGKSKTVVIPKGVKKISCSFNTNPNMQKVVFPSTLNEIGDDAFYGCDFEEITIPSSVKTIGTSAFYRCGLKKVIITNGVREIGSRAFTGNKLVAITIPKSVVSIGEEAFSENEKLTSVTLNDGLIHIGKEAFSKCNLKEFKLPSTLKSMGEMVVDLNNNMEFISFSGNLVYNPFLLHDGEFKKLTKVILPDGILSVGYFFDFPKVRKVVLPKTLITISPMAFKESGLEAIYIPEGTNYIGDMAFNDCIRLQEVSIPDSVQYISRGCFWGSPNVVFRCNENSVAYEFAMEAGIEVIGPYVKK
jgi:hypothetical protein